LLAISRCFSGLIAAKPRLDVPLFMVAIFQSLPDFEVGSTGVRNAVRAVGFQGFDAD
jgi:hypothetical protein